MSAEFNPTTLTQIQVLSPGVLDCLGSIRQTLFDFDGTISLLRQGWEGIMAPYMVSCICGDHHPSPEITQEVNEYIDRSTGILTIQQMEWLAAAVQRHALHNPPANPKDYKRGYLERLHNFIASRINRLACSEIASDEYLLKGAVEFLGALAKGGVKLYLASGSDHPQVMQEANLLGLTPFFQERIYGALDDEEAHDKEQIIQRILVDNDLHGAELLVVGDGPVEIRAARQHSAITLGVASDEIARQGWNARKARRLSDAGAEILVADFQPWPELISIMLPASA